MIDLERNCPVELFPEQEDVLRRMAQRDEDGNFLYQDWIYSAPKKSMKTMIAAGLVMWQAWQVDNGQCYVIGNDLKQADSRLFRVIDYAARHNETLRKVCRVIKYTIYCDNGTVIEALPLDPAGEAGMNPTCLCFTEVWGAKQRKAEQMYSEATLSPTRAGQAFRLLESYAGHEGESVVLERAYKAVVKDEYLVDPAKELYINPHTGTIAYWCTRRWLPWQIDAQAKRYYASEAATKTPEEFDRLHNNQWGASTDQFVPLPWWDECETDTPLDPTGRLLVIAIDAAVSGDCFAVVLVGKLDEETLIEYETKIWEPPPGGEINLEECERYIRELCERHMVAQITYDPYQMKYIAQRLINDAVAWVKEFEQGARRLKADKELYDRIKMRQLIHSGNADLRHHIANAAKKSTDDSKLRIIKKSEQSKIDAVVALSMACEVAAWLNL